MLNSSIELESLIRASGDKSLLNQYNKATLMAEQILSMQSELPNATNQTEARKISSARKRSMNSCNWT